MNSARGFGRRNIQGQREHLIRQTRCLPFGYAKFRKMPDRAMLYTLRSPDLDSAVSDRSTLSGRIRRCRPTMRRLPERHCSSDSVTLTCSVKHRRMTAPLVLAKAPPWSFERAARNDWAPPYDRDGSGSRGQPGKVIAEPLRDVVISGEPDIPVRAHEKRDLLTGSDPVVDLHHLGGCR